MPGKSPDELLAEVRELAAKASAPPWYNVGRYVRAANHHGLGEFSYRGAKPPKHRARSRPRYRRDSANARLAALAPALLPLLEAVVATPCECDRQPSPFACRRCRALAAVEAALGERHA